ncbi:MAG: ORF6N domain-containing protein [Bacteroidota bacterium]
MSESLIIPDELVISKIYLFRGHKVMLDSDLSELYGIETKKLNQAVKRNPDRFPEDFMFQLSEQEFEILRSQIVTSSWGGKRYLPYVFTEHGVLMLSSVLNSKKAVAVNIRIMRIFTKMRDLLLTHKDILMQLGEINQRVSDQEERTELIYKYLMQFIQQENEPREAIGFKPHA